VSRRAAVLLVAALAGGLLAAPSSARSTAPIERSLLGSGTFHAFVRYDSPVTAADVAALRKAGFTALHAFKHVNAVAVVAGAPLLRKAAALTGVVEVVRDHGLDLNLDKSKTALNVPKARAAKAKKGLALTGKGVTVAVIDSGLDTTHPDFEGRVKGTFNFEGGWIFDSWQDGSVTNDVAEGSGPFATVDEIGHGTHVASTVGGSGAAAKMQGLSGADYSGVAPDVQFVGFKIASAAQGVAWDMGWEANAMAAIEYLMEHNKELGVSIVQNSWSVYEVTDPDSEPIIQMVRAAVASGLIFVFSAGNNGPGANTVSWPGAMGNVITVGSTIKTAPYGMSNFSARGPQVDVVAPGSNIVAARSKGSVIDLGNAATPPQDRPFYMAISGTSMSSPHVSGVIALMKQAYPKLTGEVAEEILARTARDLGAKGKDVEYGWGFVDAYKAGQVAACLAKTSKSRREACFAGSLSRGRYKSDWRTKGDEAPTSNGEVPLPV